MSKSTDHIIMVLPEYFCYNEEAAKSNSFQHQSDLSKNETTQKALDEFNNAVEKISGYDIEIKTYNSIPNTPDSIFPNNWFSTHENGTMFIYPMNNPNRRIERNPLIIRDLAKQYHYNIIDISSFEDQEMYLEGTGSLVFDHYSKVVYAAISDRTNETLVERVASTLGYQTVTFTAYGKENEKIYHTNVMLTIGDGFAAIGINSIDEDDREKVIDQLMDSEKEIIELTNDQIYNHFAGNMIQLRNNKNQNVLVLSKSALNSFNDNQMKQLQKHNEIICDLDIPTIEYVGGGSARCMIAEIYKPN